MIHRESRMQRILMKWMNEFLKSKWVLWITRMMIRLPEILKIKNCKFDYILWSISEIWEKLFSFPVFLEVDSKFLLVLEEWGYMPIFLTSSSIQLTLFRIWLTLMNFKGDSYLQLLDLQQPVVKFPPETTWHWPHRLEYFLQNLTGPFNTLECGDK